MGAQIQVHPKCPMGSTLYCCYREIQQQAKGKTVRRCLNLTSTEGYGENKPCPFRKIRPGDLPEVMKQREGEEI